MRAVADNRDLAASSGINVERVITFVWGLGGGLAALGGVLFGTLRTRRTRPVGNGLQTAAAHVRRNHPRWSGNRVRGATRLRHRGTSGPVSTLIINPDLKYIGGLLVLIVILVVRPQGILGSRQRIG